MPTETMPADATLSQAAEPPPAEPNDELTAEQLEYLSALFAETPAEPETPAAVIETPPVVPAVAPETPEPARAKAPAIPIPAELFTAEQLDYLCTLEDSADPKDRIRAKILISERMQQRTEVGQAASRSQIANIVPADARSVYEPHMQNYLSRIAPDRRGTEEAVREAINFAVWERGNQIGMAEAFEEAAAAFKGQQPAANSRPVERQPMDPSQVMPSPRLNMDTLRTNVRDANLHKLSAVVGDDDMTREFAEALGYGRSR